MIFRWSENQTRWRASRVLSFARENVCHPKKKNSKDVASVLPAKILKLGLALGLVGLMGNGDKWGLIMFH